jgi:hypothetical protein
VLHRFLPTDDGRFRLGLEPAERDLLRTLPQQVAQLLPDRADPDVARVFPTAYVEDKAAEAEYRSLMGPELLRAHQQALDTVAATVGDDTIDEEQLHQWLGGLEVLRLVLGTQLQITEETAIPEPDPADPRSMHLALYGYLSALQDEAVQALSGLLPAVPDDDDGG